MRYANALNATEVKETTGKALSLAKTDVQAVSLNMAIPIKSAVCTCRGI